MTTLPQIRAFLRVTGMSASELARRAGRRPFIVCAILRNQCPITDNMRRRIERVMADVRRKLNKGE